MIDLLTIFQSTGYQFRNSASLGSNVQRLRQTPSLSLICFTLTFYGTAEPPGPRGALVATSWPARLVVLFEKGSVESSHRSVSLCVLHSRFLHAKTLFKTPRRCKGFAATRAGGQLRRSEGTPARCTAGPLASTPRFLSLAVHASSAEC